MKIIKITTDKNDNFKSSSDQERCINSSELLSTTDFEEGVSQFNKLETEADLYLIDNTYKDSPIYSRVATKTIKKEDNNNRILETKILIYLDGEFESISNSEQNVNLNKYYESK